MARPQHNQRQENSEFEEKVVQVSRVSKKTKGGNKIGFSVLVVVGDKNGKVGVALGKGPDVLSSIHKASRRAKKRMFRLPLVDGTIPFPVEIKRGAARLMLKPAPKGTGVIAGGAVRAVVEAAGVNNIVSKILGSSNKASNVYATFEALKKLKTIAELKGIKLQEPSKQVGGDTNTIKKLNKPKSDPKKPAETKVAKKTTSTDKAKPAKKTKSTQKSKK